LVTTVSSGVVCISLSSLIVLRGVLRILLIIFFLSKAKAACRLDIAWVIC
jgi:hypothetical protein